MNGKWRDVDITLTRGTDGTVVPKATTVGLKFSGGGTDPLVRMTRNGRELALTWPDKLPEPELSGSAVTYPDVLPDVDLRMTAQQDGFTQQVRHDRLPPRQHLQAIAGGEKELGGGEHTGHQ